MSASSQLNTAETALATAITTPSNANLDALITALQTAEATVPSKAARGTRSIAQGLRKDVAHLLRVSDPTEVAARRKALRRLQRDVSTPLYVHTKADASQ